jgi:hypothetical protein
MDTDIPILKIQSYSFYIIVPLGRDGQVTFKVTSVDLIR